MSLFNTAKNNSMQVNASKPASILASLKNIFTPNSGDAPKTTFLICT